MSILGNGAAHRVGGLHHRLQRNNHILPKKDVSYQSSVFHPVLHPVFHSIFHQLSQKGSWVRRIPRVSMELGGDSKNVHVDLLLVSVTFREYPLWNICLPPHPLRQSPFPLPLVD